MTERTNTPDQGATGVTAGLSGGRLARVALRQAREAAGKNGGEARVPCHRYVGAVKRDGREPAGFAAVLARLTADRAWELPAAGASVLDRWPETAAAVALQLPSHVVTVAFHPESGQPGLRPDSAAYASQPTTRSPRTRCAPSGPCPSARRPRPALRSLPCRSRRSLRNR
ncbi:hypothetical protein [Streptomyces sp. NPDC001135]